jgi:hypothetical protein
MGYRPNAARLAAAFGRAPRATPRLPSLSTSRELPATPHINCVTDFVCAAPYKSTTLHECSIVLHTRQESSCLRFAVCTPIFRLQTETCCVYGTVLARAMSRAICLLICLSAQTHVYQLRTHKFTLPRLVASSIPLSVDLAVCSAPPCSTPVRTRSRAKQAVAGVIDPRWLSLLPPLHTQTIAEARASVVIETSAHRVHRGSAPHPTSCHYWRLYL